MKIGAHVSFAKGFHGAIKEAVAMNASACQFFTRSPRGGKAKELVDADISKGQALALENGIHTLVIHTPYIINLAAPVEATFTAAKEILSLDIERAEKLGVPFVVVHTGSHAGSGVEAGIKRTAQALNEILTGEEQTTILLEMMAGQGSELGSSFEQVEEILSLVEHSDKIGVCGDTCHMYSAGFDLVNNLETILDDFDARIGLDRLKVFHLNDAKMPLGSKRDRHADIGYGTMGGQFFKDFVRNKRLQDVAFILETPTGVYKEEIAYIRDEADLPVIEKL
ncbi:deoxyribonuclease IV [Desulfuribacillus alkaliarsenatis]|uniref:Probable endonuclease 4 n=1 Tax=Desulfuribacillus alkaliarsenatis TaxID=766136 RepID=A0A1E5FZG9_9FIRM|nr:deoxyribonuclease IV [Desulfuribacillus alkaliarsenatis]OEF95636.1 hypothetical protein BHF68_12390 [Desulfuribacillus alkaliarsenatis]